MGQHRSNNSKIVYLVEYAGSRPALLEAIPAWCDEFDVASIFVPVPAHDTELIELLNSLGAEATYENTGGIIGILHFPRLCRRLMPMFEEIVGSEIAQRLTFRERDGIYVIGLDNDEIVIDNAHDASRLIFGNPAGRDERTEITAQGQLREVLEAIFPIPRPEYRLSYI